MPVKSLKKTEFNKGNLTTFLPLSQILVFGPKSVVSPMLNYLLPGMVRFFALVLETTYLLF